MTLDFVPADAVPLRRSPSLIESESFSIDWRDRMCRVELHGPVTARCLDHVSELLAGVRFRDGRVLLSLVDAVVTHEISAELMALSRRLALKGATLELRFVPAS